MCIEIPNIEPSNKDLTIELLGDSFTFGVFYKRDTILFKGTHKECEEYIDTAEFPILYC